MPDVYVTEKDLSYRFYDRSIGDIVLNTKCMIDEMDDWLKHNFHITGIRDQYEYVLGSKVYARLLHSIAPLEDDHLNGIPYQIKYGDEYSYKIILRCKGDNLYMPYGFFNGRSNGKGYTLEQDFKAIWGVSSFSGVEPTKVIFNGPATIVFWSDKTKTIVKRADNELDDKEKALAMCLLKKNEKLFKFCRKEAAKQEDKECEDIHDMVERFLNALTGGKDGK